MAFTLRVNRYTSNAVLTPPRGRQVERRAESTQRYEGDARRLLARSGGSDIDFYSVGRSIESRYNVATLVVLDFGRVCHLCSRVMARDSDGKETI